MAAEPLVLGNLFDLNANYQDFFNAAKTGNKKVLKKLIEAGKVNNVDIKNSDGQTPLLFACFEGQDDCVKYLLEKGANPNEPSDTGQTPLHAACYSGCIKSVSALVERGGDFRFHDREQRTAKDWAMLNPVPKKRQQMTEYIVKTRMFAMTHSGRDVLLERQSSTYMRRPTAHTGSMARLFKRMSGNHEGDGTIKTSASFMSLGYGKVYGGERGGTVSTIPMVAESMLKHDDYASTFMNGAFFVMEGMTLGPTRVTVKRLHHDPPKGGVVDHLIKECENIAHLRHPNVLLLMATCATDNMEGMVLVFERVHFGSLYNYLHEKNQQPAPHAIIEAGLQLCEGLIYIHQNNLLHNYLSSHSVFLTNSNSIKIGNFEYMVSMTVGGKASKQPAIASNRYLNAAYNWMSPELIRGEPAPTEKSDIFSFCCVMWEMFTGFIPWVGHDADQIQRQVCNQKMLRVNDSRVPPKLVEVLTYGLQPSVNNRKMNLEQIRDILSLMPRGRPKHTASSVPQPNNHCSVDLSMETRHFSEEDGVIDTATQVCPRSHHQKTQTQIDCQHGGTQTSDEHTHGCLLDTIPKDSHKNIATPCRILRVIPPPCGRITRPKISSPNTTETTDASRSIELSELDMEGSSDEHDSSYIRRSRRRQRRVVDKVHRAIAMKAPMHAELLRCAAEARADAAAPNTCDQMEPEDCVLDERQLSLQRQLNKELMRVFTHESDTFAELNLAELDDLEPCSAVVEESIRPQQNVNMHSAPAQNLHIQSTNAAKQFGELLREIEANEGDNAPAIDETGDFSDSVGLSPRHVILSRGVSDRTSHSSRKKQHTSITPHSESDQCLSSKSRSSTSLQPYDYDSDAVKPAGHRTVGAQLLDRVTSEGSIQALLTSRSQSTSQSERHSREKAKTFAGSKKNRSVSSTKVIRATRDPGGGGYLYNSDSESFISPSHVSSGISSAQPYEMILRDSFSNGSIVHAGGFKVKHNTRSLCSAESSSANAVSDQQQHVSSPLRQQQNSDKTTPRTIASSLDEFPWFKGTSFSLCATVAGVKRHFTDDNIITQYQATSPKSVRKTLHQSTKDDIMSTSKNLSPTKNEMQDFTDLVAQKKEKFEKLNVAAKKEFAPNVRKSCTNSWKKALSSKSSPKSWTCQLSANILPMRNGNSAMYSKKPETKNQIDSSIEVARYEDQSTPEQSPRKYSQAQGEIITASPVSSVKKFVSTLEKQSKPNSAPGRDTNSAPRRDKRAASGCPAHTETKTSFSGLVSSFQSLLNVHKQKQSVLRGDYRRENDQSSCTLELESEISSREPCTESKSVDSLDDKDEITATLASPAESCRSNRRKVIASSWDAQADVKCLADSAQAQASVVLDKAPAEEKESSPETSSSLEAPVAKLARLLLTADHKNQSQSPLQIDGQIPVSVHDAHEKDYQLAADTRKLSKLSIDMDIDSHSTGGKSADFVDHNQKSSGVSDDTQVQGEKPDICCLKLENAEMKRTPFAVEDEVDSQDSLSVNVSDTSDLVYELNRKISHCEAMLSEIDDRVSDESIRQISSPLESATSLICENQRSTSNALEFCALPFVKEPQPVDKDELSTSVRSERNVAAPVSTDDKRSQYSEHGEDCAPLLDQDGGTGVYDEIVNGQAINEEDPYQADACLLSCDSYVTLAETPRDGSFSAQYLTPDQSPRPSVTGDPSVSLVDLDITVKPEPIDDLISDSEQQDVNYTKQLEHSTEHEQPPTEDTEQDKTTLGSEIKDPSDNLSALSAAACGEVKDLVNADELIDAPSDEQSSQFNNRFMDEFIYDNAGFVASSEESSPCLPASMEPAKPGDSHRVQFDSIQEMPVDENNNEESMSDLNNQSMDLLEHPVQRLEITDTEPSALTAVSSIFDKQPDKTGLKKQALPEAANEQKYSDPQLQSGKSPSEPYLSSKITVKIYSKEYSPESSDRTGVQISDMDDTSTRCLHTVEPIPRRQVSVTCETTPTKSSSTQWHVNRTCLGTSKDLVDGKSSADWKVSADDPAAGCVLTVKSSTELKHCDEGVEDYHTSTHSVTAELKYTSPSIEAASCEYDKSSLKMNLDTDLNSNDFGNDGHAPTLDVNDGGRCSTERSDITEYMLLPGEQDRHVTQEKSTSGSYKTNIVPTTGPSDCPSCVRIFTHHMRIIHAELPVASAIASNKHCVYDFQVTLNALFAEMRRELFNCDENYESAMQALQEYVRLYMTKCCAVWPPAKPSPPSGYNTPLSNDPPACDRTVGKSCFENGNTYTPLRGCSQFNQVSGTSAPSCPTKTHDCAAGTLFDLRLCVCNHATAVDTGSCTSTEPTKHGQYSGRSLNEKRHFGEPECISQSNTLFLTSDNCQSFHMMQPSARVKNEKNKNSCAPGLLFDVNVCNCNYADAVDRATCSSA